MKSFQKFPHSQIQTLFYKLTILPFTLRKVLQKIENTNGTTNGRGWVARSSAYYKYGAMLFLVKLGP